eukprot:15381836-Alexandrium_andersonii.AAC.1
MRGRAGSRPRATGVQDGLHRDQDCFKVNGDASERFCVAVEAVLPGRNVPNLPGLSWVAADSRRVVREDVGEYVGIANQICDT